MVSSGMAVIAEGLTKRYGETAVLDGVDLRVPAGSVLGLLGPNGAGRTSAVRILTTLLRADGGRAEVAGFDVGRQASRPAAAIRSRIAVHGSGRTAIRSRIAVSGCAGTPFVGYSNAFSFDDPAGMCPECDGIEQTMQFNLDTFLDRTKSPNDGALLHPKFAVNSWFRKAYAASGLFDNDKLLADYTDQEWQGGSVNSATRVVDKFTRLYIKKDADLAVALDGFTDPTVTPVLDNLRDRVQRLIGIGLGYLSLTDMIYVLDEPSVGLHPRDVGRLTEPLRQLRDKGYTVLVVEHAPDVIAIADHVVDLGSRAGAHGGEIVYQGTIGDLSQALTLTGRHLHHRLPLKITPREPRPPAISRSPTSRRTTSTRSPSTFPPAF